MVDSVGCELCTGNFKIKQFLKFNYLANAIVQHRNPKVHTNSKKCLPDIKQRIK